MKLKGKQIAVTGATGFLGRYIVDVLLKRGAQQGQSPADVASRAEIVLGRARDPDTRKRPRVERVLGGDRPVPPHKFVQPAGFLDHVYPRPQIHMVGIDEKHLNT